MGGSARSNGPPHGFFLDGSSLLDLNGVYGPRSSYYDDDGNRLDGGESGGGNLRPDPENGLIYPHDHSGWILIRAKSEWILEYNIDLSERGGTMKRFVQNADSDSELEPGAGLAWSDNTDDGSDTDEAELPWLVRAIPNAIYFEQILSKQRKMDSEINEARRLGTPPEIPPGASSDEITPPDTDDGVNCAEEQPQGGEKSSWSIAEAHLLHAKKARRTRDFVSAEHELEKALTTHPRYAAALDERGRVALDAGRFTEAGEHFAALFAVDPKAPELLHYLTRVASAVEREKRVPVLRGEECEEMHVGFNVGVKAEKEVSSPEFRCPDRVDKTNWLGDDGYDDIFSVTQEEGSTRIVVRREAEMGVDMTHGWGMDLKILCCKEIAAPVAGEEEEANSEPVIVTVTEEEMESARRSSPDHFQVLGLPCDYTAEELKAAYRTASIQLHPDRPGGSTEDFARASTANECLSASWTMRETSSTRSPCRAAFERGDDLPVRQGGNGGGVAAQVERRFFPERFPYQPFGDPFARGRPNEGKQERIVMP